MLVAAFPILGVACAFGTTSVRYQGIRLERPIVPVTSIEVFRTGLPSPPAKDIGTVTVACPTDEEADLFGASDTVVGCSYERAVWVAAAKAAGIGANGIHSITTTVTSSGSVDNLRAIAFYYEPKAASPKGAPPRATAKPGAQADANLTVEERLKRLEKLKDDNTITPEEYASKRAEILKDL